MRKLTIAIILIFGYLVAVNGWGEPNSELCVGKTDSIKHEKSCQLNSAKRMSDFLKMFEYCKIENNRYVLIMAEEEAMRLGIDSVNYREMCKHIQLTNSFINQSMLNGDSVGLLDIKNMLDMLDGNFGNDSLLMPVNGESDK